jgi:GT2 family glycosyltransferase
MNMPESNIESQTDTLERIAISVVIPTFNRGKDLAVVFLALEAQTFSDFEVVVVDNSSTDNTEAIVAAFAESSRYPIRYYKKEPNGPASARNFGMNRAINPCVLFLDSDVALDSKWMEIAADILKTDLNIGAVGGQIIYQFDHARVNAFGGDLGYFGLAWDINEGGALSTEKGLIPRYWINCSAMLCRKAACEKVLSFDERFFYGFEDSDLGWKLNLSGARTVVAAGLKAYHYVEPVTGGTHPTIVFHYCKNRLASLLQCSSRLSLVPRLVLYMGYTFLDLLRGYPLVKLRALVWNVTELKETFRRRKIIQSQRAIEDSVIAAYGDKRWFPPTPLGGQRRRSAGDDYDQVSPISTQADDRV